VENLMAQFQEGVLPYIRLDEECEAAVVRALRQEAQVLDCDGDKIRLERALTNLRKQHLWGDITDEEYREERRPVDQQLDALAKTTLPIHLPNLKKAAEFLADFPALWTHPGITDHQREEFIQRVFDQVRLRGRELVAIQPKTTYQPLFAYAVTEGVRKCRGGQTAVDNFLQLLPPSFRHIGLGHPGWDMTPGPCRLGCSRRNLYRKAPTVTALDRHAHQLNIH